MIYLENEDGTFTIKSFGGDFQDPNQIIDFIQIESLDIVPVFGEDTMYRIFGGPVLQSMFLFVKPDEDNSKVEEEFLKAAIYNKEE